MGMVCVSFCVNWNSPLMQTCCFSYRRSCTRPVFRFKVVFPSLKTSVFLRRAICSLHACVNRPISCHCRSIIIHTCIHTFPRVNATLPRNTLAGSEILSLVVCAVRPDSAVSVRALMIYCCWSAAVSSSNCSNEDRLESRCVINLSVFAIITEEFTRVVNPDEFCYNIDLFIGALTDIMM